jgi:hypothetical protein
MNLVGSLTIALCLSRNCSVDDVYRLLAENGLQKINGAPVIVVEADDQRAHLNGGGITIIEVIFQ